MNNIWQKQKIWTGYDSHSKITCRLIPSPISSRDLNREPRCFSSETREPGIRVQELKWNTKNQIACSNIKV